MTSGRLEVGATLKNDDAQPPRVSSLSGGGRAVWTQTPQGWRLLHDNGIFTTLSELVAPVADVAAVGVADEKPHPSGLTRENPAVVLEQTNGLFGMRVEAVAFAPDGATLATSDNREIRLSSSQSGAPLGAIQTPAYVQGLAYAPDGTLFSAHNDGKVRQWNVATATLIQTFALGEKYNVDGLVVAPDGKTFAASNSNAFQLWDVASARRLRTLRADTTRVEFSRDSSKVVKIHYDGFEIGDLSDDKMIDAFAKERWLGFGANDQSVLAQAGDKLRIHSLGRGGTTKEIEIPDPFRKKREQTAIMTLNHIPMTSGLMYLPKVTVSPDGTLGISQFVDGTIGIWDVETGKLNRLLRRFQQQFCGRRYFDDGVFARFQTFGDWQSKRRNRDLEFGLNRSSRKNQIISIPHFNGSI